MTNADNIRTLTDDVVKAYGDRIESLASIRQEVSHIKQDAARMLDGFKEADKERASEVSHIKQETARMLDGFRNECEDTANAWHGLVSAMQSKRGQKPAKTAKVRYAHGKGKKD
ncbi:MAG: hypothetical protein HY266_08845 [Deltaproteobacteria bacterium]|nr:hypothetical protein [Deltaproteobacteria bacterium]